MLDVLTHDALAARPPPVMLAVNKTDKRCVHASLRLIIAATSPHHRVLALLHRPLQRLPLGGVCPQAPGEGNVRCAMHVTRELYAVAHFSLRAALLLIPATTETR